MSIKFEDVTHIYGTHTPYEYVGIKNVNLNVKKNSITAIIGHTGSGKSTLIQHINALMLPTRGRVIIDDFMITSNKSPKGLKELRKKVGFVFQFPEYQLFEDTVEKDIMFGPLNFGVDCDKAKENARIALKTVGLDESFLMKSPFDLSGGQKRRVAIAGILVMNPDILVLDEPTAGLDPQGTREMLQLFKSLNEQGKTIIMVTHHMDHVLDYCDEVVLMNDGQVAYQGDVTDLFHQFDILEETGIKMPTITQFSYELNKYHFSIDMNIKEIDALACAIKEEINGKHHVR